MPERFNFLRPERLLRLLLLLAMLGLVPVLATAQSDDSGDGAASTEEAAAEEPAAEEGPDLPANVINPEISPEELELRLIPLTAAELEAAADTWRGIAREQTQAVVDAQIAGTTGDELAAMTEERRRLFDNYTMVLTAWDKKGGNADTIAEYRAYRTAVVTEGTRTANIETLLAELTRWATSPAGGLEWAKNIGIVLAALFVLLFVARLVRRGASRWIGRVPNLSKLLQAFLVTIIYWIVLAIGLMVVLSMLGIDISPVFALIGGASFIMAFAFQDTLGNLASGLMIMINRPFDEGDYVDVGGVGGTVRSVSIVATTIVTPDNQVIVIPNKNVWGDTITNVTASATRRVDLVFGIGYDDSIPDALRVIEETVKAHPLVLEEPAPAIRVHELADSSVNFICRPWVQTGDYWTVYWDLMQQMKQNFDAAGISIPYPQQDVHMHTIADAQEGAAKTA
ncbi:mechanosensitive ion channel [Sulfitobacter sp. D35]|uniref:mechanosensitive ion channel family protein n=1 Tax=Sulfitobacter sp. D35 TaxID=3083252 RepID=UPI00296EF809|nr:mechanosensitive ion channel domain-containing protein [Sulfitobacter sp. D35]MDW4498840.1 mechanosensitive ion channel [Sulfitobacter sp. D35]